MAENKGLVADVRPGSVEVTGQQRELFPFDAFRYRNADLQPGEQDTESIYSDDTEPALDMNDPFSLNMRGRNSKANVRSIRVSEILGPDVVDQAIPDVSDFDLDATFENDEVWDAGNAEGFEFDDVAGDERGEYDAPRGSIAIKAPVLLTGGLYIDDDETKLRLTSTSFKLGSISEDGLTGTGFVYDFDADTMKYSGELEAATGTFSGELSGGSIDIGGGDFKVLSNGDVTANNIDIAGGTISGSITATGTITGGTLTGSTITSSELISDGGGDERIKIKNGKVLGGTSDVPLVSIGTFGGKVGGLLADTIDPMLGVFTYSLQILGGLTNRPDFFVEGMLEAYPDRFNETSGTTIIRMLNIATSASSVSNAVWRDSNGYLRIS